MTDDLLGVMKHGHVCPIADQHYAWAVAEITRLRSALNAIRQTMAESDRPTAPPSKDSDGQPSAGGMQMSASGSAITRRPAHPMDTISGGPIGPSDASPLSSHTKGFGHDTR